ncbi:MAG: hypothetical protein DRJ51_08605 [Thermoprotei archaeon]|nr:MAG: hypothetical protein DRJ51_08605 [Thermoprotei archaeon]
MRISIAWLYAITKYGYPPNFEKTLKALEDMAKLGFKYVELEGVKYQNLLETYENRRRILEHVESLGLKVINFCPVLPDIVSLDSSLREKAIDFFRKGAELSNYFGADMVQVDSFTPPIKFVGEVPYKEAISYGVQFRVEVDPSFNWNRFWNTLVQTMKTLARIAASYGLKLVLEPRVGETISNTDAMLRLMDAVNEENFGAVLDTGHLHAQKEILPLSVEKLGSKVFYVHVSDNDSRDNRHLTLGEGTIDWVGVFKALKKHHYDGYVAIDIGGSGFTGDLDEAVVRSKNFLEKLFKELAIPY